MTKKLQAFLEFFKILNTPVTEDKEKLITNYIENYKAKFCEQHLFRNHINKSHMKKISIAILSIFSTLTYCHGQSKVFKEVSEDMETKVEAIMQENNLVGYLVFTKLEKVSKDSFSYRLSFLDENLNDIGEYKFRDQNLQIQDVAFDEDVMCIGYLRNNAPETMGTKTFNYSIKDFPKELKKIKIQCLLSIFECQWQIG